MMSRNAFFLAFLICCLALLPARTFAAFEQVVSQSKPFPNSSFPNGEVRLYLQGPNSSYADSPQQYRVTCNLTRMHDWVEYPGNYYKLSLYEKDSGSALKIGESIVLTSIKDESVAFVFTANAFDFEPVGSAELIAKVEFFETVGGGVVWEFETSELQVKNLGEGNCAISAPSAVSFDRYGGSKQIQISAPNSCVWCLSENEEWLDLSATTGQGSQPITIAANSNFSSERSASLFVGDQTIIVSQAAASSTPCSFSFNSKSRSVSADGEIFSIDFSSSSVNCSWIATENLPWVQFTGPTSGGPTLVQVEVEPNPLVTSRTGTITIAGEIFPLLKTVLHNPALTPSSRRAKFFLRLAAV